MAKASARKRPPHERMFFYILDTPEGDDEVKASRALGAKVRRFVSQSNLTKWKVVDVDIGAGASLGAFLVEWWGLIPTAYAVLISAKPIQENIPVWKKWATKTAGLIRRAIGRNFDVRMPPQAAFALALDHTLKVNKRVKTFRLVGVTSIAETYEVLVIPDEPPHDGPIPESWINSETNRIFVFEIDGFYVHAVLVERDGQVSDVLRR